MEQEYISENAKQTLEKELKYLIKEKRKEIACRLEETSGLGDLSENAEYHEAKEEQLLVEQRILTLEDILSKSIVMKPKANSLKIIIGSAAVLRKDGGDIFEYVIVGSEEANTKENKISNKSPLGEALMGKSNISSEIIKRQMINAIDIVVQVTRFPDGSRKVVKISELLKSPREYDLRDIFVRNESSCALERSATAPSICVRIEKTAGYRWT